MINLALADRMPFSNPDVLLLTATFSGNYGVNLVGDLLNLSPVEAGNANGVTDPHLLGGPWLGIPPTTPIFILSENIGGYYCQVTPNANPTFFNFGLRVFAPGGGELGTNAAYAAAVLAGSILLGVKIPQF